MSGFKVQSWNKSDGQVSGSNPLCCQTLRLDAFFDVSVISYCERESIKRKKLALMDLSYKD